MTGQTNTDLFGKFEENINRLNELTAETLDSKLKGQPDEVRCELQKSVMERYVVFIVTYKMVRDPENILELKGKELKGIRSQYPQILETVTQRMLHTVPHHRPIKRPHYVLLDTLLEAQSGDRGNAKTAPDDEDKRCLLEHVADWADNLRYGLGALLDGVPSADINPKFSLNGIKRQAMAQSSNLTIHLSEQSLLLGLSDKDVFTFVTQDARRKWEASKGKAPN